MVSRTGPLSISPVRGIPTGPDFQRGSPHPSLYTVSKHASVISILKPVKDPALPSTYRPIFLLDTIGIVFENILLTRIFYEVREPGLTREQQFGFRPRHSTSLQLAPPRWKNNQELWRNEANWCGFPRCGQNLRYRLDRWPPLQANAPKLFVLHWPYNLIKPPRSDVWNVLPDGRVISSRHAGWCGSGWTHCSRHL